jgi:hypothetical protein
MDLARGLETLFVVAAVSALTPLVVALLPGPRIPQVVVLIAGVLRRWAPGDVHALEGKLDAVAYGFFIPGSSSRRA